MYVCIKNVHVTVCLMLKKSMSSKIRNKVKKMGRLLKYLNFESIPQIYTEIQWQRVEPCQHKALKHNL